MSLECRGCDTPVSGLTNFCAACLDLPEDLTGVKDWKPKVVRAVCVKDRLRVAAIHRIVAHYKISNP